MHTKPYSKKGEGKRSNLIRARLAHGWSQADVAKKVGCSRELYSQIENGGRDGRTMSMAEKLGDLFQIQKEYIMQVFPEMEVFGKEK